MKKTDMSIKKRNKRIMQLRKEGLTQAAIADNVGCSTSTVQRVLGVRPIAKKQSRPTPKKVVKATKPAANTGFVTEYSILWGAFKFVKSSK